MQLRKFPNPSSRSAHRLSYRDLLPPPDLPLDNTERRCYLRSKNKTCSKPASILILDFPASNTAYKEMVSPLSINRLRWEPFFVSLPWNALSVVLSIVLLNPNAHIWTKGCWNYCSYQVESLFNFALCSQGPLPSGSSTFLPYLFLLHGFLTQRLC